MATIVSSRPSNQRKPSPALLAPVDGFADAAASAVSSEVLLKRIHLTRPDGSVCFEPAADRSATQLFWERTRTQVRSRNDAALNAVAKRAEYRDGKPAADLRRVGTPAPGFHDERQQTSVLRTDWSPSAAQVAIDWSQPALRCDLAVGSDLLAFGNVSPHVVVNGQPRAPLGTWEEVCRQSDDDADYLELEIALEGECRLQRQLVLTRTDGLFYWADAVFVEKRSDLEVEVRLPLAEKAVFQAAADTRDVEIVLGRRSRRVIPPALAEWRTDRSVGELTSAGGLLTLRQTARDALAVYAPLCLVTDVKRSARPVTWRRLTVGENLQIQPADRAVGYRLQLGQEHWLVYRSLTSRANRTVLGVNLQADFLCARFLKDGSIERLMEIEE